MRDIQIYASSGHIAISAKGFPSGFLKAPSILGGSGFVFGKICSLSSFLLRSETLTYVLSFT